MAGQLQHLSLAFISMPGGPEWFVILIIGLLVFGRRLPEVARGLGRSVNEFKRGLREFQDSADEVVRDVNKIKDDVETEVKTAAGLNDYDSHDAGGTTDQAAADTSQTASDAGQTASGASHGDISSEDKAAAGPDETTPPASP